MTRDGATLKLGFHKPHLHSNNYYSRVYEFTGLDYWTGLLDWTTGLDYWTGLLDWTTGLDYWTGLLDWTTGLDYWTGLLDWTTGLDYWTAGADLGFEIGGF